MLPTDARSPSSLAWSIACALACARASAGESLETQTGPAVEEVVVTALKRSTLLQETPMSMLAVAGETLRDRGIDTVADPNSERIDDYTLTNLRFGLRNDLAEWAAHLFVNNVFDEVAIGRVLSNAFGRDLALSTPPRTIGVNLSKEF